jgi:MYXO-CTERM domain-containing protein
VPVVPSIVLTDRLAKWRSPASAAGSRGDRYPAPVGRTLRFLQGLSPQWRDAFLYSCSAVFAGLTALAAGIPLYRQWGQMAFGPYVAAAAIMALVAWRLGARARSATPVPVSVDHPGDAGGPTVGRGWRAARIAAFLIVLFGATVVPLALEVIWASEGNAALHVQPEVLVVEQAGARAAHGKDPYQVVDRNGHIVIHEDTEPIYELYYPYLPGMVLFGFSSGSKVEARLTDARIQFLVFTSLIALLALSRLRPRTDARFRALQLLTVLPTAALPLATGGDDMPVAALMLLGLTALQRRRPVLAGLALGAASSLKFTAWPLVILAAWGAWDLRLHRAVWRYLVGVAVVLVPVVVPVALRNPSAFIDNVVRFPLGLAGVSSPAASALPGHIFVSTFPGAHRPYLVVVGVVGGIILVRHLLRHPPHSVSDVASLTGWVMLVAILLAPATRVGYLLYPINLFAWAWMLRQADDPVTDEGRERESDDGGSIPPATEPGVGQLSSGISYSSTENGVTPAAVVGDTTVPASQ